MKVVMTFKFEAWYKTKSNSILVIANRAVNQN